MKKRVLLTGLILSTILLVGIIVWFAMPIKVTEEIKSDLLPATEAEQEEVVEEPLLNPKLTVEDHVSLSVESDLKLLIDYEGYGIPTFFSFDEDVVTVTEDGLLTGIRPGETDVAVKLESDGKYRSWSENVHVTVTAPDISKTIFLTYDDGPSGSITPKLLDTLKRYDAHATFFIIGKFAEDHRDIVRRAYDEGHTIAIHTYTHDYRKIYGSIDAYLEDFNETEALIEEITGKKPRFWRFPGGSNNGYTNRASQWQIIDELRQRGYTPMDWNVSTTDAAPDYPSASTMVQKGSEFIDQMIAADRIPVVLMHDSETKVNACAATETFIEKYGALGYDFRGLDDYYEDGVLFISR